jgi:hypothetical protein
METTEYAKKGFTMKIEANFAYAYLKNKIGEICFITPKNMNSCKPTRSE